MQKEHRSQKKKQEKKPECLLANIHHHAELDIQSTAGWC